MSFNKDDCNAIFLMHKNSINETIKNKVELIKILRESGRHANDEIISKYWKNDTREITFTQFLSICRDLPIIIKSDLIKQLRLLDSKNEGFLDKADFLNYLINNCREASKRDLSQLVEKADQRGSDRLEFDDIATLLLSNSEPYRKLARMKLTEPDHQFDRQKSMPVEHLNRSNQLQARRATLGSPRDAIDEESTSLNSSRGLRDLEDLIIEKLTNTKMNFKEPRNLKAWKKVELRGVFFVESPDNAVGVHNPEIETHRYSLSINATSNVLIVMNRGNFIQRIAPEPTPDMAFLLVNDKSSLIGLSMPYDATGAVYIQKSLSPGKYFVIPLTTGAKLTPDSNATEDEWRRVKIVINEGPMQFKFTPEINSVVEDVFKMCDIDANGFWSRNEFNWYNMRTSEVEEDDDEDLWEKISTNYMMQKNELTSNGFIKMMLDQVRSERGDTTGLTTELESIGFNAKMELKEAFPFTLTCQVESAEMLFECVGLFKESQMVQSLLCNYVIDQGEKVISRNRIQDCNFYTYIKDGHALIVIENINSPTQVSPVRLELNMDSSNNVCWYNNRSTFKTSLKSGEKKIVVHGVSEEPRVNMSFKCTIKKI